MGRGCQHRGWMSTPCWSASRPLACTEAIMDGWRDERVQGLFFRDDNGKPIGAIARFSPHPAVDTGLASPAGGDYPASIRCRLQEAFGGEALFLTDSCGNQAIAITNKRTEKARQIGASLANKLLTGLRDASWASSPRPCAHGLAPGVAPTRRIPSTLSVPWPPI